METPIGTILTRANISAGHYTQWVSIIILLLNLCGVSLRKTDLSNIKMNVPFPKELFQKHSLSVMMYVIMPIPEAGDN
jgi:hypothetical protein